MKEMQARAEELLNHAIEAPTETNVVSYMAYQRLLTRRAEQFARTWQRILWQYPGLDPTVEEPVATAGLSVAQAQQAAKRDAVLSRLARTSGLLYFFSGDCPLCEVQSPILVAFAQTYGFPVVAISLDGSADSVFGVGKIDRGAAKRLGVEKVPAIFLARPPSEVVRVGTGLLAMEDLAVRLYHLNEGFGETNDENPDERDVPVSDDRDTHGTPGEPAGPGRFAATTR
jgi:conjugal transfer pilus assembly protein TraF